MAMLNEIISVMNKEETRALKIWLNSTNASDARMDVKLFDYIRKSGESYDEDFIHAKLYPNQSKNSFYKLKHRLQEDIGLCLASLNHSKIESNSIHLHLSLYHIFLSHNQPVIAHYYLKKAEKQAQNSENLELLDIIYGNYVRLAGDLTSINPEEYIRLQKENGEKLRQLREVDQILATVTYRLKATQNYGASDAGLMKMLDNIIRDYNKDATLKNSRAFQSRIFKAVSQVLIQKHDFVELEKYVMKLYNEFGQHGWFDKSNHELKIQMLIYIINSTFKNRKFTQSLDFAETLGEELSAYNNLLYQKYLFFYYNALVINYAQIDLERGLKALDEAEKEMKKLKNSFYEFFILLNRSIMLFFKRDTNKAIRNLVKLKVNDHYKSTDKSFQLKIAVVECIMQLESGDDEFARKRVEQVRKEFSESLSRKEYTRESFMLKILPEMSISGQLNAITMKKIHRFVNLPVKESVEDAEVIKYREWLKKYIVNR